MYYTNIVLLNELRPGLLVVVSDQQLFKVKADHLSGINILLSSLSLWPFSSDELNSLFISVPGGQWVVIVITAILDMVTVK